MTASRKQILTEIQHGNYVLTTEKPMIMGALGAIQKPESSDITLYMTAADQSKPV